MKCAWQYFRELPKPEFKRTQFISRWESYHGATLGALSLSGHKGRRKMYAGLLAENVHHVSPCNPYHRPDGMTIDEYRDYLLLELDAKFEALGPGNVVAFVAEPIVGAVSGSHLPIPEPRQVAHV
jgi:adenosylmethionine-8-amino-7-oxononanoate aminotransferase